MMKRRTVLSILLMVGTRLGLPLKASTLHATADEATSQPLDWIPITWVQEVSGPRALRMTMKQYRRADGSVRSESGPNYSFISILNIAEGRFYVGKPGKNWEQHPMRPQPSRMALPKTAAAVAGNDPRVVAVSSVFPNASFAEVVSQSGATTVFCPDLNMLLVWHKNPAGQMQEITSMSVGVADDVSFTPPPDATIDIKTNPEGLGVSTDRRPHAEREANA